MSCPASPTDKTITVTNLYIQTTLDKIIVDAQTCGQFTGLYAFVNEGFLLNQGTDLTTLITTNQIVAGDSASVHLELLPEDIGLSVGSDIDTIVILRFDNTRIATSGVTIEETKLAGVASYASIYPCLINKIEHVDGGCNDCEAMNNALLLDMLMQTVSAYLSYERFADAVNTYNKMKNICLEYDLMYSTNPTTCDLYGGIGCWIINSTFQISSAGGMFVPATPIAIEF